MTLAVVGFVPRSSSREAAVRTRVHALWEQWAESAGAAGEDFVALTAAAVRSVLVDGEAFVRLRTRRPEDKLPVSLALELVDAARIPFELTEQLGKGGTITQGIERDRARPGHRVSRRRLRAWRAAAGKRLDGPAADSSSLDAARLRRGAARPGPRRELSWRRRYHGCGCWTVGTMQCLLRQQLANLFAGFVTNPATPEGVDASVLTGRAPDATQDGRPVVELEPGILQELAAGEKVDFSDPPDPPRAQDFGREQARLATIAAGVPLPVVSGDWAGQNDRIARVTLNGLAPPG